MVDSRSRGQRGKGVNPGKGRGNTTRGVTVIREERLREESERR